MTITAATPSDAHLKRGTTDIEPFYTHGVEHNPPAEIAALAGRILEATDEHRNSYLRASARLTYRGTHAPMWGDYEKWHLVILETHYGYGAEILDRSNDDALIEYAEAEGLEILELHNPGSSHVLSLPLTDETRRALFPDDADVDADTDPEIDPDPYNRQARAEALLTEIGNALATADSLADYPVLDEDDFTRREFEAWEKAVTDEVAYQLPDLDPESDEFHEICRWIDEAYHGYAEPDYCAPEWVAEAIANRGAQ